MWGCLKAVCCLRCSFGLVHPSVSEWESLRCQRICRKNRRRIEEMEITKRLHTTITNYFGCIVHLVLNKVNSVPYLAVQSKCSLDAAQLLSDPAEPQACPKLRVQWRELIFRLTVLTLSVSAFGCPRRVSLDTDTQWTCSKVLTHFQCRHPSPCKDNLRKSSRVQVCEGLTSCWAETL